MPLWVRGLERLSVDRTSLSCAGLAGWMAGFPICELLIKLATFWLGATRNLLEGFGALQKSGFPICELLIHLATFWIGSTRSLLDSFFWDLGPFKNAACQYVSC